MTHLSREKREPLPTYRVLSDDMETYYGRIQKDRLGQWWVVSKPGHHLGPFDTRAKAVAFIFKVREVISGGG